ALPIYAGGSRGEPCGGGRDGASARDVPDRGEHGHAHGRGGREREQHDEREADDEGVARPRNQAGRARRERDRARDAGQRAGGDADAQSGRHGKARATGAHAGRSQHVAIHARVEIAERTQALTQLVDIGRRLRRHGVLGLMANGRRDRTRLPTKGNIRREGYQTRRLATNAESSSRGAARGPNGCRAASAVRHSSAASSRAPSTPPNDTKVVLRASARTALPVSAGSPVTSSRSSTIWNARPRFFA